MPHQTGASNSVRLDAAAKAIDSAREELVAMAVDIHAHPELNYQEHHAAKLLSDSL